MHFTEPVYRNPYWPTYPLLQITQGCTHNRCKFCSMYKGQQFRLQPMEWIEEDLDELARIDWTLDRMNKGYHAEDIIEQCTKLEDAGIDYWMTFLNGIGGRSHWRDHAQHSAEVFSQLNPLVVGTGGLTLFPDTELFTEEGSGAFDPLDERGLMEELLLFVSNLDFKGRFITHHTSSMDLNTNDFGRDRIIGALTKEIEQGDMESESRIRLAKRGL